MSLESKTPDPKMAARLLELRLWIGYTQAEIGLLVGRSSHAVANWEAGRHGVGLKIQRRLANVYDVSLDVIRGVEPVPKLTRERQARLERLLEEAGEDPRGDAESHHDGSDPAARRSADVASADAHP